MKSLLKRFFNLSTQQRINYLLKAIISLSGVVFTVFYFIDATTWHKLPSYLVTIVLPYIPEVLAKLGFKVTTRLQLAYNAFLIIAMVLGIDLDWYKNIIIMGYPSYDKIVHTLSGIFAAFGAKEILDHFYDGKDILVNNKSQLNKTGSSGQSTIKRKIYHSGFAFLFIICFVVFTAAMWECFEFSYDQLFGGHMQELNAPGVGDTMGDIISASVAGFFTALFISKK
jgi:hypothetical protein